MKTKLIIYFLLTFMLISIVINFYQIDKSKKLEVKIVTLTDSLKQIKVETTKNYFKFDRICVRAIPKKSFLRIGDSCKFDLFLAAFDASNLNSPDEPYVILGSGFNESTNEITGQFDSIQMNDWEAHLSYKQSKLGEQLIYGKYYIPNHKFPLMFSFSISVFDNAKYNAIESLINNR